MMWKVVFLLALVAYTPLDCRKSGGSSGGSRGSSPGRQTGPQPGGGQPGGGFGGQGGQQPHYPAQGGGGFGGQQPGHFGGGGGGFGNQRPNQGGFMGGRSSFGQGSGPGSISRGTVFKTALAGAALGAVGGLVTYQLGKAVLNSFDRPFQHDNRNYYWDQQYYRGQPGQIMCSMPMQQLIGNTQAATPAPALAVTPAPGAATTTPNPDQLLSQVVFPNGTRPKEIVWSCKQGSEVCCGTECCPAAQQQGFQNGAQSQHRGGSGIGSIILGIILVLLLICCCCGLIAYKFCRSAFDFIMPSSHNSQQNQNTYYDDSKYGTNDGYGNQQPYPQGSYGQPQQQSYPMQPYPQGGYQPPQQYPSYPPPPGGGPKY